MKLGYMTNGFGPLVGEGAGVTSVKDIRYLTLCDDEEVLRKVTGVGFRYETPSRGDANIGSGKTSNP